MKKIRALILDTIKQVTLKVCIYLAVMEFADCAPINI